MNNQWCLFKHLDQNDSLKHYKVMELRYLAFSFSPCVSNHMATDIKQNIKYWWKIVADTTCAKLLLATNHKVIPSMGRGQRQNLVTIKQMKNVMLKLTVK